MAEGTLNRGARRKMAQAVDTAAAAAETRPSAVVAVDALVASTLRVSCRDGSTLDLWDDVPTHRLLYAMRLLDVSARQNAAAQEGDFAAYEAVSDERDALTLDVVTMIVRHTHSERTRDEVAALLPPDAREAVIGHFFTHRLTPFFQRANVSRESALATDASPASPDLATVEGPPEAL